MNNIVDNIAAINYCNQRGATRESLRQSVQSEKDCGAAATALVDALVSSGVLTIYLFISTCF